MAGTTSRRTFLKRTAAMAGAAAGAGLFRAPTHERCVIVRGEGRGAAVVKLG